MSGPALATIEPAAASHRSSAIDLGAASHPPGSQPPVIVAIDFGIGPGAFVTRLGRS